MALFDWLLLAALILFGIGCVAVFTRGSATHYLLYKSFYLVHKRELVTDAFYLIGFLLIMVGAGLCFGGGGLILGTCVIGTGAYLVATARQTGDSLVCEMQKDIKEPERVERQFTVGVFAVFIAAVLLVLLAFMVRATSSGA